MTKTIFSKLANTICASVFLANSTASEGTSIIVYRTAQNIVVASDSKAKMPDGTYDDHVCKIASTPNGIVVGVAGRPANLAFLNLAAKIAGRHPFQNQNDLDAIAGEWAESVEAIYKTTIGPANRKTKTERGTEAIFIGYDKSGNGLTSHTTVDLYWKTDGTMDIKVGPVDQGAPVPPGKYVMKKLAYAQETYRRLSDPLWNQRPEAAGVLDALTHPHTVKDEEDAAAKFTRLAGNWFPEAVGATPI
jgi:hypothetical protein